MKRHTVLLVLLSTMLIFGCNREKSLFEAISPGHSGITFSNRILENDTLNILSYEYVYNGGGVGVGDFNDDGLQDVFFTGNMLGNKLYLNQGDFKFLDVTESAGVAARDQWNSGVAVIDINNDGWLDVYVCATTHEPGFRRANQLYINNGQSAAGLTFTEMAAAYGIADESHTTHAAFFDYDNDGDQDLYLLINQMDEYAVPSHFRKKIDDGTSHRTDKLFRNDFDEAQGHAVFTDVSSEAGISIEGFGLGVNICDINQDGWKDIYVSNDYLTNDLLWINNGPGDGQGPVTFTDKASDYFKHTSYSAMGNNVADLNNDGLSEIIAVDMLPEDNLRRKTMLGPNNYMFYINNDRFGYQYQYVRNTLQFNRGFRPDTGEPLFSDVSMHSGISSTDWSWTPLVADFDHDGFRDIIITNGFPKDVTDRDFMDYNGNYGTFVEQDKLVKMIPSVKISNYAFRNKLKTDGNVPAFENVTVEWGLKINSFSNGAAYVDLDNDGDLDLVTNNINDSAFIYRNNLVEATTAPVNWLKVRFKGPNKNINGLGAIVEIYYDHGRRQSWENTPYRGYLSSVESGAHFGLGPVSQVDSLIVIWQEGRRQVFTNVSADQILTADFANAGSPSTQTGNPSKRGLFKDVTEATGVHYKHSERDFIDFNIQRLLLHKFSQFGPGLAVGDVNGDTMDDFYVGGSHHFKGLFLLQGADGRFVEKDLLPGPDGEQKGEEELGVLFFDADNDGDSDLYLVSGGYEFPISDSTYQDRLFLNQGGQFILAVDALPKFLSSGSCVKAADFDRDGDLDLFVGGRVLPYQYPKPVSSYILVNDGRGHFSVSNEGIAPMLNDVGLISDALWTDYNNDGWIDLLLAGEWMPLRFLQNQNGKFVPEVTPQLEEQVGFWNSLVAGDFDLDGDMDYIAGNLGTNTLLRATQERPISIYAADFDDNSDRPSSASFGNGLDAIPSTYLPNIDGDFVEFPFFGRSDMEKQLVAVKKAYMRHHDFGVATMPEVLAQFPDIEPVVLKANYLYTAYIENKGEGDFEIRPLPSEAQLAPVYGMIAGDFDGDDQPDLILNGNDYGTELGMGRYDALNGLFLSGDGKGNFKPLTMNESGICFPGDGKSLVRLHSSRGEIMIVAGQNNGALKVLKTMDKQASAIPLEPLDCSALIKLQDGRSYREELPYGQSFLSQSARSLILPGTMTSCEITDYAGNSRTIPKN